MKTVGKQLQEARLAKNWTPELASRETKIKVDRLRDLEADDYSHFTSPAYARGFVRTYARSLGLDEYKILRQLDNKLPEDDSSNLVTDSPVAYLPETSMPPRVAHRDYTGLYVVMGLGCCVLFISAFVLYEAYRVGELPGYFSRVSSSDPQVTTTDAHSTTPTDGTPPRAVPVDPNDAGHAPKALPVDPSDAGHAPKALPVDPSELANTNATTNAAPQNNVPGGPNVPPKALPVDPSELNNPPVAPPVAPVAPSAANSVSPPRATQVDPSELTGIPADPAAMTTTTNSAPQNPPASKSMTSSSFGNPPKSARQSNTGFAPKPVQPAAQPAVVPVAPVAPTDAAASPTVTVPAPVTPSTTSTTPPAALPVAVSSAVPTLPMAGMPSTTPAAKLGKNLVLTASQDSFVRVISLDAAEADKPLYAATLRGGQSIAFDGRKFSINVGVPSAVDIKLDGVSQPPLGSGNQPETFTLESHQP